MASVAIAGTLAGCIGCMLDIESISKRSPGCMNLMTCATFVSISLIGLIKHSRFFTKIPPNKIPLMRGYLPIVVLFFLVSVSNNLALNFDISVPLFIVFRSGTLLANLLLGRLLLGRIYSWRKIFAVIFVTVGVVLFTMASSQEASSRDNAANRPQWVSRLPIPPFAIGIGLLTCALFTSAYLGICQENLYRTYGKHPDEAMFFIHALSLPGFLFLYDDIWQTCIRFSESPPLHMDVYNERLYVDIVDKFIECNNGHNATEVPLFGALDIHIRESVQVDTCERCSIGTCWYISLY
uniref:UDP-xylose and UDP-N-acetylglucosamine transporter n=1 Tax=Parascaris univalens TaxID=6257 RepID=A0A915BKU8_PARUN